MRSVFSLFIAFLLAGFFGVNIFSPGTVDAEAIHTRWAQAQSEAVVILAEPVLLPANGIVEKTVTTDNQSYCAVLLLDAGAGANPDQVTVSHTAPNNRTPAMGSNAGSAKYWCWSGESGQHTLRYYNNNPVPVAATFLLVLM